MDRRIGWAFGLLLTAAATASAQFPPGPPGGGGPGMGGGPGFFPAAPAPLMGVPNEVLDPGLGMPPGPMGGGYGPAAPRFPVDETGHRAINWLYSQTDFMFAWVRDAGGNSLLTTGTLAGGGVIGAAGTQDLGNLNGYDRFLGIRQTLGVWLNPQRSFGLEASAYVFEVQNTNLNSASDADGNPLLARPFLDATTNDSPNARFVSYPGAFRGSFDASSKLRTWGADSHAILNFYERTSMSFDFLAGFRFMSLEETLAATDYSQALANGVIAFNGGLFNAPAAVRVSDQFQVTNRFYGGSLGLRASGNYNRVSYSVTGKVGLGSVRMATAAQGTTTFLADGVNVTTGAAGGMFVQAGNFGRSIQNKFAALPELNVKLGFQLTRRVSIYGGYDLMYLSEATRPQDTINRSINPTLLPSGPNFGVPFGPAAPQGFATTDFLLQAVHGGLMIVF